MVNTNRAKLTKAIEGIYGLPQNTIIDSPNNETRLSRKIENVFNVLQIRSENILPIIKFSKWEKLLKITNA